MEREELVKKWLKGTLTAEEEQAFKNLEDHTELERLVNAMPLFKAPDFDTDTAFNAVKQKMNPTVKVKSLLQQILPIAAILVLAIGIIFTFRFLNTASPSIHSTQVASQKIITLPDASKVQLNALSTLSYNKDDWSQERVVELKGEAFFKVAKGETFTVKTKLGDVIVLGTQFNVQQHDDAFRVTCYEGSVKVSVAKQALVLTAGDVAILSNNSLVKENENTTSAPSWISGTSSFKSVPYRNVLKEFERQYNVTIEHNLPNETQLFTGNFTHQNLEKALQTITLPLQYTYAINKNTVTIYVE